jgi:hypothetical protein
LEAIIVPMAVLERDESRAANTFGRRRKNKREKMMMMMIQSKLEKEQTGNGLGASGAALGEKFSETLGAVRFLVLGSESLAGQRLVAVSAGKALTMPGVVLVSHSASRDDLHKSKKKVNGSSVKKVLFFDV